MMTILEWAWYLFFVFAPIKIILNFRSVLVDRFNQMHKFSTLHVLATNPYKWYPHVKNIQQLFLFCFECEDIEEISVLCSMCNVYEDLFFNDIITIFPKIPDRYKHLFNANIRVACL